MIRTNRKLLIGAAGVGLLAAAMLWLAFNRGPLAPVQVEIAAVTESGLTDSVFGIGTVEARYAYAIGPTQAGRVLKVLVDHGDTVRAGQLLAEIDPVDLQQRLSGAGAALQRAGDAMLVAEAQEREAQSRHDLARANAARYRDLAQKNFVSREAVEIRDSEARVTVAALEAARAALRAAQQDFERAGHDRGAVVKQLASLRLTAPVAGLVTAREAEPGTTVVAGQAVVRVIDPKHVWVRARIDQSRAAGLAPGLPADIVLRSNPAGTLSGKVARVEIQSDAVTEERIVTVALDAPPQLSLGELAEVTIHRGKRERGLVIPSAAVKRIGEQQGVWQVADGTTRFRAVKTGVQTLEGMTEVLDGLAAGDTVIVYSSAQLRAGIKVRIGKTS
jgi:HlyD family secretion protein